MKTSLCLGSALGILLCTSSAFAAIETYKVTLNGAQEVPAVTTTATGTGTLTLDTDTNELTGTITLVKGASGLADITGAHIHEALCGANKADPAFDLADGIDELTINVDGQLEDADVTKL
jgi:hypothetical protein